MKILKFWANWCAPCKMLSRELESFNLIPIESVDIDAKSELAKTYSVRKVPTLILVDENGEEMYKHVGFINSKALEEEINGFITNKTN